MTSKKSKLGTASEKQKTEQQGVSTRRGDKDGKTAVSKDKSASVRSMSAKKRMRAISKSAKFGLVGCSCNIFVIVVSIVAVLVILLMNHFFNDSLSGGGQQATPPFVAQRLSVNYSREFQFRPTREPQSLSSPSDRQFPGFVFADMNEFCQNLFGRCSFFDAKFVDNCSSTFCHALFLETSLESKTADRFAYPPYLRIKNVKVQRLGRGGQWPLRAPDYAPCGNAKQKTIAGYCEAGSCVVGGRLLPLQILPKYDQMAKNSTSGFSLIKDLSRSCVRTSDDDKIDFERLFHPNKFTCPTKSCDMTQLRIVARVCDNPYPFLGAAHCTTTEGKYINLPFTFQISGPEYSKIEWLFHNPTCDKAVRCNHRGFCNETVPSTYSFCCLEGGRFSPWGLTIGGFCVLSDRIIYVRDAF